MGRNEALDWLARNVHEWPTVESGRFVSGSKYYGPSCNGIVDCKSGATKQQWLNRRAELQGKPSWDDLPEWVQWLAQWPDGEWLGYEIEPECEKINDGYVDTRLSPRIWRGRVCGEVLGDWRDTLERRPVANDWPEETRIDEIGQNGNDGKHYSKRKAVYIAGPITGVADYHANFKQAELDFMASGRSVLNPAMLPGGLTQAEYMDICFAMLRACDTIALLPGWQCSAGARAEHAYAEKLGMEVIYL